MALGGEFVAVRLVDGEEPGADRQDEDSVAVQNPSLARAAPPPTAGSDVAGGRRRANRRIWAMARQADPSLPSTWRSSTWMPSSKEPSGKGLSETAGSGPGQGRQALATVTDAVPCPISHVEGLLEYLEAPPPRGEAGRGEDAARCRAGPGLVATGAPQRARAFPTAPRLEVAPLFRRVRRTHVARERLAPDHIAIS